MKHLNDIATNIRWIVNISKYQIDIKVQYALLCEFYNSFKGSNPGLIYIYIHILLLRNKYSLFTLSQNNPACNIVSFNQVQVRLWYNFSQSTSWITRDSNHIMMTSSNGNIFRVAGSLCGEFTGPRWIPYSKASDTELWCFLWSSLNKRLSKYSWGWWLRRHRAHYDVILMFF